MDESTKQLIMVVTTSFAVSTTVIGILFRQLLRSYREHDNQRFEILKTEYTTQLDSLRSSAQEALETRRQCEAREHTQIEKLEEAIEKLRDRWEQFVRDDAALEATRGRKVDALFGVVDHIKEEVRGLKPIVIQRLEDSYHKIKSEVTQEIRADLRREGEL